MNLIPIQPENFLYYFLQCWIIVNNKDSRIERVLVHRQNYIIKILDDGLHVELTDGALNKRGISPARKYELASLRCQQYGKNYEMIDVSKDRNNFIKFIRDKIKELIKKFK